VGTTTGPPVQMPTPRFNTRLGGMVQPARVNNASCKKARRLT
jgi:hypothetical protein